MATLQNKTVVVVGGSSGIGFGVALAALQSLASVVIIASSNASRVSNAVERLKSHKLPGEVRGEVLDARDAVAIKEFAAKIGVVDHVAWTSGDLPPGLLDGTTPGQAFYDGAFTVRFWGPYIFVQSARFHPGGSLTLTSGSLDTKPRPGLSATSGVVAALEGLTKGLAVDLAPVGVRVNVVGSGAIWDHFPSEMKESFDQLVKNSQLIGRLGTPSEIAEAYIFLMKCGYITGQRVNVDGGIALA
ncbi:hypothetical protein HYPSUDRAFT_63558 [Hypholoma sublateritium FD-334 SS-4]|uniref:Uncharacterized protein n=1 Tax=Hypholoma sublateritium (strain FD-334 SS-4) TaxID=945553 RepID=A0A0D2MS17_HYPSF|nr:hypothetical protein HYPSUDRAFT_63558 [Hypholoma sublateritium FD-334 SS-4]